MDYVDVSEHESSDEEDEFVHVVFDIVFPQDFSPLSKSVHEILATGLNCRIGSVEALEGDAQYFIIRNIGDCFLYFSINMIRFEKVGG